MTVDNFFDACNEAIEDTNSDNSQIIKHMNVFAQHETESVSGNADDIFDNFSFDTEEDYSNTANADGFDLDFDLDLDTEEPESTLTEQVDVKDGIIAITPLIKPHAQSLDNERVTISSILTKYFVSKGVKIFGNLQLEDVAKHFSSVHSEAEGFTDPVRCVQYLLWITCGIPLAREAIEKLDWRSALNVKHLRYTHREVALEEIELLSNCTDAEFELCNNYSLRADLTANLLSSYRNLGDDLIKEIKDYLESPDVLKSFLQFKAVSDTDEESFTLARDQGCVDEYVQAVKDKDLVTQKVILEGNWKTHSRFLPDVDKKECEQFLNYHYFPLILDLMSSGFSNKEFYDEFLKEPCIVGDFMSRTANLTIFKLLHKGLDIYTAVLTSVYRKRHLIVNQDSMFNHTDDLHTLALAYMEGKINDVDVILHTIFMQRNNDMHLDTTLPINAAVMKELSNVVHFVNVTEEQIKSSNVTTYQLVFQKSSLVFDIYEFIAFTPSVMALVNKFANMRNTAKVYFTTPEICAVSFGDTIVSFINSHRELKTSLQNWIEDSYCSTEMSASDLCSMNGNKVYNEFESYKDADTIKGLVKQFVIDLYSSADANKADLIFDYLLHNQAYIEVLRSDNRVLAFKLIGSVIYLEGFSRTYCFLRNFVRVFPTVTLDIKTGSREMPTSATAVVSLKTRGKKVYSFDSFMNPTVFDNMIIELSKAKTVRLYYSNTIHFEVS